MSKSYTPGLKILECTNINKKRILPLKGKVHVDNNEYVDADKVVASTKIPGNVQMLNIANELNIDPDEVPGVMLSKIDDKVLNQHKKYKLLESYEDGYNYSHIAKQLANAELINGDYRAYNRNIELLKNLSNEDIKRVVNKYLISDNMIVYHMTVNEKSWYTPIVSFITNQIILRFWNPGI